MSQDPTTSSGSEQGSALADDEHFIRRSAEELRKELDVRMRFVWRVIESLLLDEVKCYCCPRVEELWFSIIEGDDDDDDDDLWLWVDGDEKWLTKQNIRYWMKPDPTAWPSAQSALRRRIARKRYPPATARNEKVRNATPEQRICAIAWLIVSSKGVANLFASHGRTPPTLRTPHIADTLSRIIRKNWDASPSRTDDWESALTRSAEDGCICSPVHFYGLRGWFDVMVWLEDIPPVLVVGDEPCVRCRSLLESRYEVIVAKCAVTLQVSFLDIFCNYYGYETKQDFSPPLGPTARLQANRTLEPLMKKHGCNVRFSPLVNRYPDCLRPRVADLFCGSNPSCQDGLSSTGLPDDILDGAYDPWVVLGIIALASYDPITAKGTDFHDENWHSYLSSFLHRSLKCFDMPVLPRLSSTGFTLCHTLDQDDLEERSFGQVFHDLDDDSDWVRSHLDGRQLRLTTAVTVAVTTFLRNKDVDLHSCRRCQSVCMEFPAGIPSTVGFEVANSGDRDNALGQGPSSPLQGSLELSMQEPVGMEAFTNVLRRKPTLSKDEIHSRVTGELHRLRQYLDSFGLDILDCLQHSDGGNRPYLRNTRESTLPRHLPGRSISSSSMRSKSDKVEEVKDKLLGMLRELNLPYERLPWYTLEKDLKKHGCALVNWPAGVVRKRGNRGIHDLSAVEVSTLYEAITHPDESRRLRICRCSSTLTVVPVNHTSTTASGSKRPLEELNSPGHPSRRIRFRDMTSKVSQQHLSDLQAGGASGS
ncbi:hypothetical protein PISMIDRAFT_680718 [Pisolithus microcarpus 441]|uniref:Uncharacterized protein n=1 Tax=Pisolithus microcarpus 441 TaxID=765257 RepID=A0A0C9ZQJ1_9AGAM|nr:hypothetical protein BKA83DRAFT_680718 [Pisolithus microcarpus]KIK21973.1 hypothetical protein PISMIDRAFT_680718 [Pisolithus microcarpus 441]